MSNGASIIKQSFNLENTPIEQNGVNLENDNSKSNVEYLVEEDVKVFLNSVNLDLDTIFLDGNTTRCNHEQNLKAEQFLMIDKLKSLTETLGIRNVQIQVRVINFFVTRSFL